MSDQPKDTRLWCLHHIGADDVYPAPDFATAQKWADWANTHFAEHADISRFVVAVWPHTAEGHAEGLPAAIAGWAVRDEQRAAEQAAWKCKARSSSLPDPQDCDWPFCGCDPHAQRVLDSLSESGMGIVGGGQPLPADVIALVIAGRRISEVMQNCDVSPDDRADVDAFDKALGAFASRVCWDDEGGTLPEAHGDNCTCDLTGEGEAP